MPILIRIGEPNEGAPGFLIPIFRNHLFANEEFLQQISPEGDISEFIPFQYQGSSFIASNPKPLSLVGEPAIWVFRDPAGKLYVGDAGFIKTIGLELLKSQALRSAPMIEVEMALFCSVEQDFPDAVDRAIKRLKSFSTASADTWVDTMLLLPAIKRDFSEYFSRSKSKDADIREVLVLTKGKTAHVYAPRGIVEYFQMMSRWRELANICGIRSFEVHTIQTNQRLKTSKQPLWTLYGFGSIGRYVTTRAPFNGIPYFNRAQAHAVRARGAKRGGTIAENSPNLVIGIISSDLQDAKGLALEIQQQQSGPLFKHIINVRPLGFGTPRPNKLSPYEIAGIFNDSAAIWIVSNHRLRQTGRVSSSLSAMHNASRFTRTLAECLISFVGTSEGNAYLESVRAIGGYCLMGVTDFEDNVSLDVLILRSLYTMLTEEAILYSAKRIIVRVPGFPQTAVRTIRLASYSFKVEVIGESRERNSSKIVSLAIGVELSRKLPADFREFCILLLAGFGWELRHQEEESLLFENEGEALRVWPTIQTNMIKKWLSRPAEYGNEGDVIITNQSIKESTRVHANDMGWRILHYSELDNLMNSENDGGLWEETD